MNAELVMNARDLVAPGKGILAADESDLSDKFEKIGLECTPETRRQYRQLLFTAPGIEEYISGIIIYRETFGQTADDGTPFAELLASRGIMPGIKVDKGKVPIAESPEESITIGLDGLGDELEVAYDAGARLTKWRGVIVIGDRLPTRQAVRMTAGALGSFARISQDKGHVPIVEPEVLMDGSNSIERCAAVTSDVLEQVFEELVRQGVDLRGMLLKPNMVVPGKGSGEPMRAQQVAEATLEVLKLRVPEAVPGIVFLSGGMSPEVATANLNAMNVMGGGPWELSFSYGRALQDPVRAAWAGKPENVEAAQAALLKRARLNSLARYGKYTPEMEKAP